MDNIVFLSGFVAVDPDAAVVDPFIGVPFLADSPQVVNALRASDDSFTSAL
jgi:hypothetical protein